MCLNIVVIPPGVCRVCSKFKGGGTRPQQQQGRKTRYGWEAEQLSRNKNVNKTNKIEFP